MNVVVAQRPEDVQQLFALRLWEAQQRLSPYLQPQMSMEMGGSDHFAHARGYASTLVLGGDRFHLRVAEKFLSADLDRQDAILRHEIGHIVDFSVPSHFLASLISGLPATPERRADGIASWLWGETISYDAEDVQTLRLGTSPRPERLGL
jgi:hypothetical protein